MSNSAAQADTPITTYRVLRELGRRSQHSLLAVRGEGSVVVLNRYTREANGEGERVTAEEMAIILRDARCLAKNWHPNLAQVRHVDVGIDTLHVATELLEGVTLEELLALGRSQQTAAREPALSHAILARIFLDVLSGLGALHGLRDGINTPLSAFHGELCPANVIVGKDGVARVVSVFRPRPVMITAKSEAVGYAAPETLAGEVEQDGRVDLYAVGVMLWEALMDRRLYDEVDPTRVAQRQREDDIARPQGTLADVAMRALSFDPALRFRSAHDMAASIRALAPAVAQGSVVAQTVVDLAGDSIRTRRAAIASRDGSIAAPAMDVSAASRRSPFGTPVPARSGTHGHASVPSFGPEAPTAPGTSAIRPSAPTPAAFDDETPSVPRVLSTMAARELRDATPSAPDVETAYAPRPLPARRAPDAWPPSSSRPLPPPPVHAHAPRLPDNDRVSSLPPPDDDDLPGPRQSTPDDEYLEMLAAEARAAHAASEADDRIDDDDLLDDEDDGTALEVAREIVLSKRSIAPTPGPLPVAPAPLPEPAPPLPSHDQRTALRASTPASTRAGSVPPRRAYEGFPRTQLVIDFVQKLASQVRADRRLLLIAILVGAALIMALVAGVTVSADESGSPDTTRSPAN